MTDTDNAQKKLAQKALRQIRSLCQGNGVAPDSVQIKNARSTIIECQAITHVELHPETTEEKKKGRHNEGQMVESPAQLQKIITEITQKALKNNETRKHLTKMLIDRPDKGFSLHAEYFDVDPLKRDFCFHEACGTCSGKGNVACNRCGGQKREVCNHCHGRSMLPCTYCHGSGFIQDQDGEQSQCNRCFGQRQTACNICQKTGSIGCRQCSGSGALKCNACGGSAFFTHITHLNVRLKTLFEIDRAALPDPVVKIIEDKGNKMVEKGHIRLHAEPVKREDGGLAIQYTAQFPYGDLELSINGKPLKAHIFGYKGKMLRLPNFLDQLIAQNFQNLEQAANNKNSIDSNIKKASKSRFIAEGLLLSVQMPPKKAMLALKKKFPMGASGTFIKQVILLSSKALNNATRKTRFSALAIGTFLAGLINAAYFFSPAREALTSNIENQMLVAGLDLLFIPLGGFICDYIVKYMAKRPLQRILGPLVTENQRGKFKLKTQGRNFSGYIVSAIIFFVIIFATKFTGAITPSWFPF